MGNVSLTNRAVQAYRQGNYAAALALYRQLAERLGERNFQANILLCEKRLALNEAEAGSSGEPDRDIDLVDDARDPFVQADRLEAQFDLSGEGDLAIWQNLLLQSFQLDSSYVRGRRLAAKGVARGMLTAPARIYASIQDDPACTPQDKRTMRRIISQEQMRREPLAIPPRAKRSPYVPDPRTSLLFFYSCLPYQSNGYATRTHGICTALQNGNRNAVVFSRPGYPWDIKTTVPIADYDNVDGVIYRHLGGVNLFAQEFDTFLDTASNIVEALARTHRASVLHAASNWVNALPVLLAARRLGIPFVYEVRGLWEITRSTKVNFDWTLSDVFDLDVRYESLVTREADYVVPITHGLKDELICRGADGSKMAVAPNGVNLANFEKRQPDTELARSLGLHRAPTIGFVGSFVQYEGLDDLIHAARRLKQMGKRFNLLLVGDGDEFERLKTLVAELELNREVFMPGRVSHHDVAAYYSLIDIAPFPRKPLKVCELVSPLKPFEAMAMGKTVLVSNVAAMAEFIEDGVNGFSFEKGSVDAMTERLATLIDSPVVLKSVGERACAWVAENRTWAHSARIIEQVHESLSVV